MTSLFSSAPAEIKIGDKFPLNIKGYGSNPAETVDLAPLISQKKCVIFGVPGAFTPTCHGTHVPGYLRDFEKLKSKGVDHIICISVNDPFVMSEWAKVLNAKDKIIFVSDMNAEISRALGIAVDNHPLGFTRCKRFSMVTENAIVTQLNIEPSTGATCSLAENIKL